MPATIQIEASPESIERYRQLREQLARRTERRWFCDRADCDGQPHEDAHWCDHPLESDEHTSECRHARSSQRPPWMDRESTARYWIVMAGRGWGKTRTGAEWLAHEAKTHPGRDFGVVGRTIEQTREVCMEGESGLLRALGLSITSKAYNRTTQEIKLPNGATIYAYTAENPDSMRGPNLSGAWCDELASWHYEQAWTEGLIPATRIGEPLIVITTTPRRTKLLRDLVGRDDGTVHVTRGSTFDNAANLSEAALTELHRRYDGTRIGRQELDGELLEDVPGALWTASMIEESRGPALAPPGRAR